MVQPRVPSTEASQKTIHDRSALVMKVRNVVSGGDMSSQIQLADELRHTDHATRKAILKAAGLTPVMPVCPHRLG